MPKEKFMFNEMLPLEEIVYKNDVYVSKNKKQYEITYYNPILRRKEKIVIENALITDEKEKEIEQAIISKNIWIIYGYIVRPIRKIIKKNKIKILSLDKKQMANKIYLNNLLTIRKIKALEIINRKIFFIKQNLANRMNLGIGPLIDQILEKKKDRKKELIDSLLFLEYARKQIKKLDIEKIIF